MDSRGPVSALSGTSVEAEPMCGSIVAVGYTANSTKWFEEAFCQFNDGLSAMSVILREMEGAVKKQPNVSRAIKDAVPKLEENIDKLQCLTKSWPKSRLLEGANNASRSPKEGGKSIAVRPPTVDTVKSAKKIKADKLPQKVASGDETPLKEMVEKITISSNTAQAPTSVWTTATGKKFRRAKKDNVPQDTIFSKDKKKRKRIKKRGGAKKSIKPEAILLKPVEGKSYADVLSAVRTKVNPESCGVQVQSIRRTKAGEVLLELQKSSPEKRHAFQLALKQATEEACVISELVSRGKLKIMDLDDCTSTEEVKIALQSILEDYSGVLEVSLTKPNGIGQRMAIVYMEAEAAKVLVQRERVKIDWVYCRIRAKIDLQKCYKCLAFGHYASVCNGPDRSNRCFHCGSEGHKAADCKSEPSCFLCSNKGADGCKHVAGSSACGAFRKAVEDKKRGR